MHPRTALTAAIGTVASLATLAAPALTNTPASCSAISGATIPAVIELYTSEGCDSCPPADRWLGSLKDVAARGAVLPLAFHVDYWDYIGWKDRFADPAFGVRQRERANAVGARVVYTPQVVYDDRELQRWASAPAQKLPLDSPKPARADLRVSVVRDAGSLAVDVRGAAKTGVRAADAYVALYESGLESAVSAGENKGATLRHDFVVRRWLGPFAFDGSSLAIAQSIAPVAGMKLERSGVAVIARDRDGAVIQAVALPLRDCAG